MGVAAVDSLDAPAIAPGTGAYTSAQNVSMSALPGATIRYTTNGSEPDGASTAYTGPVNVDTSTQLKARAFKPGYTDSPTAGATYTFNYGTLAAPALTPAQSFITSGSVTMSAVAGATIRYTTNGTDPTASSTEYTGPVTVDASTAVRAKAFKADWTTSPTTAVTYVVKVATPIFGLAGGTHPRGRRSRSRFRRPEPPATSRRTGWIRRTPRPARSRSLREGRSSRATTR